MRPANAWFVAKRVMTQFRRDHRSVAMLLVVPIVVMSLLSLVVDLDVGELKVGVYAEGTSEIFASNIVDKLGEAIEAEELFSAEEASEAVASGGFDAVLVLGDGFLTDRLDGRTATIAIHMAGTNPALNVAVMRELRESMSGILDGVPALVPASCSDECAESVNTTFPELSQVLLHGHSDLRMIDFHASFFATFFVFFFSFIFSSLAFFRERTLGTLERLLVCPTKPGEIFAGYLLAFFCFGMVQATVIVCFLLYVLDVYAAGSPVLVFVAIMPTVLIAESLGIFVSAFSKREFQVLQFMPIVVLPQVLLSNLFWPVAEFPWWLRAIAMVMPEYHADRAARVVLFEGRGLEAMLPSIAVLLGMCALIMAASAAVIRKSR